MIFKIISLGSDESIYLERQDALLELSSLPSLLYRLIRYKNGGV